MDLQASCKEFSNKIKLLDIQCSTEMVKRFGESVTMQDIESFAVNRTLEEMKEISRRKERQLFRMIKSTEVKNMLLLYLHGSGEKETNIFNMFQD